MNIKKMILGVGAVLMLTSVGYAEKMPCYSDEEMVEKFYEYTPVFRYKGLSDSERREVIRKKLRSYSGASWCQNCLGGCHYSGDVPLGAGNIGVALGYKIIGTKAIKYDLKIIVKQKKPCYVVSANKSYEKSATTRKINNNTVEIITKKPIASQVNSFNFGRRGLDYKYMSLLKQP